MLAGALARRASNGSDPTAVNWTATLAQEIEIAGGRGARLRAAEHEKLAQKSRAIGTERDTATLAWAAYFDAIADREQLRLAEQMETLGALLARAARARADRGVGSTVDADVAEAAQIRIVQERFAADRQVRSSTAALASLTGGDPLGADGGVDGELVPLHAVDALRGDTTSAVASRPEIAAARAERSSFDARASAFRRARVPNVTVSVFAQNDGYHEKVLGMGLALPIPIPGVGRTYAGEIAEANALAAQASSEVDRLTLTARLELATALQGLDSRRDELDAFSKERLERAEKSLGDIATEIEAGRLGVRDALLAQQALIDLLRSHLEARRALCLASVELARAANLPLERGVQ
ncbi:Heavy metal RND efflux outer membrane protein, CzcC family [Labilithrix luteola]|uniref:Heavy metal RND efflux outer membrane protein, CzcC family n=1 Tax=Labilithrix luteola TaxID=1391654 RepID=A0A0K1PN37_9BACT|nr:Heavy metal RND efflux outer membrane protein, CzcC family [Labilithrix luteola]